MKRLNESISLESKLLKRPKKNSETICNQTQQLPISFAKTKILEILKTQRNVILIGEAGSGKTTQIPQYLHEAEFDLNGSIVITQPRRMAAISIAKRVAQEMNVKLGNSVGYKVRFDDMSNSKTKIIYLTDGLLLREALLDPTLLQYSCIILDEAHERTINTDILFGVIKNAQNIRYYKGKSFLNVIVMSATLDGDKFSKFFNNAPILYVSGRRFPINVRHASTSHNDWQNAILSTIFQIHHEAPDRHDILVFLTGQEEIEIMSCRLKNMHKNINNIKLTVFCLYASQCHNLQHQVFTPTKSGYRKVILSTNIAETSLTIPGVRFVIDSCRVKIRIYQQKTGLDILKVDKISKSQGWQRTGRAGRESEGHCYRILTKNEFDSLKENTTPEIFRCNLSSSILQMLAIGIKNPQQFNYVEKPTDHAIEEAMGHLKLIGAIDRDNNLSTVGKLMSGFPLDPSFTKVILSANDLKCTEEILSIIAILSGESIYFTPTVKRTEAYNARKKFFSAEGDLITYLKIFREFKKVSDKIIWCQKNFIRFRQINFAEKIRQQLFDLCRKKDIEIQSSGKQYDKICKAFAKGLFTNVAILSRKGYYITINSKIKTKIHPSSILIHRKPEAVVFIELIITNKAYMRELTIINTKWLFENNSDHY